MVRVTCQLCSGWKCEACNFEGYIEYPDIITADFDHPRPPIVLTKAVACLLLITMIYYLISILS